jgi:hypothetical protein
MAFRDARKIPIFTSYASFAVRLFSSTAALAFLAVKL